MIRRRIRYTGRVQGVGFRATAASIARHYQVTGWVRNEADGSVLLEAQGEDAEVDQLCSDVRSRMAGRIADEHAHTLDLVPDERRFAITHA